MAADVSPSDDPSRPARPPEGADHAPAVAALLTDFVEGGDPNPVGPWRVEGAVLSARDVALAIRMPNAVLVRHDRPDDVHDLVAALASTLVAAGLSCVEEATVLGYVIGIEEAGIRGSEWDLWATDAHTGHAAVKHRALGEVAERIDDDAPARRARQDDTLREIERRLWG